MEEKLNSKNAKAESGGAVPSSDTSSVKMGAVGDKNSIQAFRGIGMDVFFETELDGLKNKIRELEKLDYKLILVAEKEAEQISDFISTFDAKPFPVIMSVPDGRGTTGYGINKIFRTMEKTIGSSSSLKN